MSIHFQLPLQVLMVKVHRTFVVKHTPFSLAVFSFSTLFGSMQERKGQLLELIVIQSAPSFSWSDNKTVWFKVVITDKAVFVWYPAFSFHSLNPFLK